MRTMVLEADGARITGSRPSMLASLVVHTGLIALAALGTQAPPPVPPAVRDTTIFLPIAPRPARPAAPVRPSLPGLPGVPRPLTLDLPTTIGLPAPGLPDPAPVPGTGDPWPGSPGAVGDPGPGGWGAPGAVVDASVVETPPRPISHPRPRYPDVLRQAGIEGEVVVEAVLDTLGAVERGSTRIVRGAHAFFEAEALAVVAASRYEPGRMGTRAVRVRILVPIRFALRR